MGNGHALMYNLRGLDGGYISLAAVARGAEKETPQEPHSWDLTRYNTEYHESSGSSSVAGRGMVSYRAIHFSEPLHLPIAQQDVRVFVQWKRPAAPVRSFVFDSPAAFASWASSAPVARRDGADPNVVVLDQEIVISALRWEVEESS